MCLYPRIMKNKRYMATKKNGGIIPKCEDTRQLEIEIPCGNCIECRKQKAQQWRVRLMEELNEGQKAYFVTLTFSNEGLKEILSVDKRLKTENNAVCAIAIRRFLERWRKKYKKSIKHWFITELGHTGTERIHIHGIVFTNEEFNEDILSKFWKYGRIDIGEYCTKQTINYIIKYVTKVDNDHPDWKAQIYCSAGLGKRFIERHRREYKYIGAKSRQWYKLNDGTLVNLPKYYRNKIYTEEQRIKLWSYSLDEDIKYIMGYKIEEFKTDKGQQEYDNILQVCRRLNIEAGYGDDTQKWKEKPYNATKYIVEGRKYSANVQKIK